jgi:hypothetical protein
VVEHRDPQQMLSLGASSATICKYSRPFRSPACVARH